MRYAIARVLVLPLVWSCAPELPEGRIRCDVDGSSSLDCPDGWFCHADERCYSYSTPAAEHDASSVAAAYDGAVDAGASAASDSSAPYVPPQASDGAVAPLDDAAANLDASEPVADAQAPGLDGAPPDGDVLDAEAGPPAPQCDAPESGIVCGDDRVCNGRERCDPKHPDADARGCVAGSPLMCSAGESCSELLAGCSPCSDAVRDDRDDDGHEAMSCGGGDCDDADPTRYPGAAETCDGKDNDCDGTPDGAPAELFCVRTAPSGAASSCVAAKCAPRCLDPDHDLVAGACVKHNDCPASNPCAPGTCIDGLRSYACVCPSGYAGSTTGACTDIDECAIGTHNCDTSPAASCTNTPGGYTCQCQAPATGSGLGADGCMPPPVDCTNLWTGGTPWGAIPAGLPIYARINKDTGTHTQYLCRLRAPNGSLTPGKVNGGPNNATRFEYGCYGAYAVAGGWDEAKADATGETFELFAPPAGCDFDWSPVAAAAPLPANAFEIGKDPDEKPIYACRAVINDSQSTGMHIGRIGEAAAGRCIIQYFADVRFSDTFEVLVRF